MSANIPRIGVPQVYLSNSLNAVVVPACSALTFTASGVTPTDYVYNDANRPLLTTDVYQVAVALFGDDIVNGGYAVGVSSPSSGNLVLNTQGDIIEVRIPNANWPTVNFQYAAGVVVFLKTNSGNFQVAGFGYVDPSDDCVVTIKRKPLPGTIGFPIATLLSGNPSLDPTGTLGSRSPRGFAYAEIEPTTGTLNVQRAVSNVTVAPNNGPNYQVKTNSAASIRFQSLVNNIKAWVQAAGGLYVAFNSVGGGSYQESEMSLATAQALLQGNKPIKLVMPLDPNTGLQEIRIYFGNLTVNQTEITEAWSKDATTPVNFAFDAAAVDKLIVGQHTEISYLKVS